MSGKRAILGGAVLAARVFGLLLLVIAIFALPQMRSVSGVLAPTIEVLASVSLGLIGIAWLVGVKYFLKFFDQCLSRN